MRAIYTKGVRMQASVSAAVFLSQFAYRFQYSVCKNGGVIIKAMHKVILTLLLATAPSIMAAPSTAVVAIAEQTDPAKLATLKGERAANPRMQKCVYWLAYAEEQGEKPEGDRAEGERKRGT
jgi:hypothetical protein